LRDDLAMSETFDFEHFVRLPRISGLSISPHGDRLIMTVSEPHVDGKKMASALWEIDLAGDRPPRRLTRSAAGESSGAFLPDGSVLFTSARPDPEAIKPDEEDSDAAPGLWLLPADGGEARLLLAPKGGVEAIRVARRSGTVALAVNLFPGTSDVAADAERAKARREAGVDALLFESYPIRHWDHYLGPREKRILAAEAPAGPADPLGPPRDLLPDVGTRFEEMGYDITPDGATVVASLASFDDLTDLGADLFAIDVASGRRRAITPGDAWYDAPACAPDGGTVACIRVSKGSPEQAEFAALWEVEISTGMGRALAPTFDLWPTSPVWAADGSAVYFLADRDGRGAAFRADVATGDVTCLVSEGTLGELVAAPDGDTLYALRSTLRTTPEVVRLAAGGEDQTPALIASPASDADHVGAPGVATRIEGRAPDGTPVGGWLVVPREASADAPVPLLVLVHGGPLGSWTDGWHWRWNPQLFAARGYAALMPDPGFSTGYGREFIQRGWGRWDRVYDDVIAVVDATTARPEIDAGRTALLGGSFGGYMANWVAGHTDRFRAIVTHASLWELRGFQGHNGHRGLVGSGVRQPVPRSGPLPRAVAVGPRGRDPDADAGDPW
jgi:dipeptidyl aminopeptidase/acylaminoacyl peptidase